MKIIQYSVALLGLNLLHGLSLASAAFSVRWWQSSKDRAKCLPPTPKNSEQSNQFIVKSTVVSTVTTTALIFLSSVTTTGGASAVEPGVDITHGSVLFESNCAGCHRGGMNFIKEKKTLQKDALEKFLSLDQPKVQDFVQNKMPHQLLPFKKEFSNQDYLDVTSFVLDQALQEKW
jgi:cytochrome c6